MVEVVTRRHVDLGFVHGPVDDKHVSSEFIWETEMACLMPRRHPLAKLQTVKAADLRRYPLISLASTSPPSWLIGEALSSAGMPPKALIQTNLSVAAYALVDAGAGVALIDPLAQLTNAYPRLVVRSFGPPVRVQTACLYSTFGPLSQLANDFLTEVRATISDIASKSQFISLLSKSPNR